MTAFGAGGVFACMWAYIFACKSVVCAMDKSWYNAFPVRCAMPNWVALSEVFSAFVHNPTIPRLFTPLFSRRIVRRHPRGPPVSLAMACEVTLKSENHGPFSFLDQYLG